MKKSLIEGRAALLVIDIQASTFIDHSDNRSIPNMPDYADRMLQARKLVDRARASKIPVIFVQEALRRDLIDFGRELDGSEGVHCLEGDPGTEFAFDEMRMIPGDYKITKRRYSCFFDTDLEILLKGLKTDTILMCGGLTDVCVHYTFVDGHQHDYHCRVIEDAVAGSCLKAHEASLKAMEYLQTGARCSLANTLSAMKATT